MAKFNTLATLALAITLAACSSSGTQVTADQMGQFHKGSTTYTDVVNKLGEPTQTSMDDSGNKTISYVYTHSQAQAQTFVPIVGGLIGGTDMKNSTATFTFNPQGVLIKKTQSQGGTSYSRGISQ